MAQEVAQERTLSINIKVYKDPEDSLKYKADLVIDGYTFNLGGLLDRKYILDYLNIELQDAWAYLGFLEKSKTEESRKHDLEVLMYHLERALVHALAYEIGQDNLITPEEICRRLWEGFGEKQCAYVECAGLAKEDFEACMEACRIEFCGSKD